MSDIVIIKGFPIMFNVGMTDSSNNVVNINDGTWTANVALAYQTKDGPSPFTITPTPNGSYLTVSLANTQTSQLSNLGTGYVLVIRASKNDQSVFLKSEVQVAVKDDL